MSEERTRVLDSLVSGFLDGFARVEFKCKGKRMFHSMFFGRIMFLGSCSFWKNNLFSNREIKTVNRKIR